MTLRVISVGQKYLAHSTDIKPIAGISVGAFLREYDTGRELIFNGDDWEMLIKKSKTYEWENKTIPANDYISKNILVEEFDQITAFVCSSNSVQTSFRVVSPNGDDYAWDILGNMNSASIRNTAHAQITGLPMVKLLVTNSSAEPVSANIIAYLGKS